MKKIPLGASVPVPPQYAPDILFAIERSEPRRKLGISDALPFVGRDVWNCYELSWLNPQGAPISSCCRISYSCDSPKIVESKSLKLYLYSLNMTPFAGAADVQRTVQHDLARLLGTSDVTVELFDAGDVKFGCSPIPAIVIDHYEMPIASGSICSQVLEVSQQEVVEETVSSNVFRSLCPVTAQPDWASLTMKYVGPKINHASLFSYLVSYREHQGFHEECCERIFFDIMECCKPRMLSVMCRFLRRGGIDINPIRTTAGFDGLTYCRDSRQ